MDIRQNIAKEVAILKEVPLETVEKIISFQWKDAKEAIHLYNEVEISGLGKFVLSPVKVRSKLKRLEAALPKMQDSSMKQDMEDVINFLKTKYEIKGDIRGVEESSIPSGGTEGSDRADEREKDQNL